MQELNKNLFKNKKSLKYICILTHVSEDILISIHEYQVTLSAFTIDFPNM